MGDLSWLVCYLKFHLVGEGSTPHLVIPAPISPLFATKDYLNLNITMYSVLPLTPRSTKLALAKSSFTNPRKNTNPLT
uniref:Putative ovule protein n=1 Tax=Solanum chacoense TaxID=4108 RepID=A0A0V0H0Y6_SOLCH